MSKQQKKFIELIKHKFVECKELGVDLLEDLQASVIDMGLLRLKNPTLEDMKKIVSSYFDAPSIYDTGSCSKLFMNAINEFNDAESTSDFLIRGDHAYLLGENGSSSADR